MSVICGIERWIKCCKPFSIRWTCMATRTRGGGKATYSAVVKMALCRRSHATLKSSHWVMQARSLPSSRNLLTAKTCSPGDWPCTHLKRMLIAPVGIRYSAFGLPMVLCFQRSSSLFFIYICVSPKFTSLSLLALTVLSILEPFMLTICGKQ